MTTIHRPTTKQPMKRVEIVPKKQPPSRRVRWIAWTLSVLVIGLGALVAILLMRDDGTAEGFSESELTALQASVGEADRVFDRFVDPSGMTVFSLEQLAGLEASTGEADRVFERYIEAEFARIEASVGSADQKYLDMSPTG